MSINTNSVRVIYVELTTSFSVSTIRRRKKYSYPWHWMTPQPRKYWPSFHGFRVFLQPLFNEQGRRIRYGQVRPGRTNNCLAVPIIVWRLSETPRKAFFFKLEAIAGRTNPKSNAAPLMSGAISNDSNGYFLIKRITYIYNLWEVFLFTSQHGACSARTKMICVQIYHYYFYLAAEGSLFLAGHVWILLVCQQQSRKAKLKK